MQRPVGAVAAAVAQADKEENLDPEPVFELMTDAVNHVGDVSFQDRADAIVAEVGAVIPEFFETLADIAAWITKIRNGVAPTTWSTKRPRKRWPTARH